MNEIIVNANLNEIWKYLDEDALYAKYLGLKKQDIKKSKFSEQVQKVKEKILKENLLEPKGVYQFFKARFCNKNNLCVLDQKFFFTNCPAGLVESEIGDICLFVVTAGEVAPKAKEWMDAGDYLVSHILLALSMQTAEAMAEWLHQEIRRKWGIGKDQGMRVSFGYSLCPNLEDQAKLWKLLEPEKIGVKLTENFMMQPEASVSAVVFK